MAISLSFRTVLAAAGVAAVLCMITPGNAAPVSQTVTRTLLERTDVPGTQLETRLYLMTYPPGVAAPVHHHPVAGVGYIVEGTARSAYGTQLPATLTAGESFQDKVAVPHTVFANADAQKPLVFLIAYTVRKGAPVVETP